MSNKFTKTQYDKVKNYSFSVVSFKDGKRTLTYGGLSFKQAMDHLMRKQMQGEICLIIPGYNTNGVKGLENGRYYKQEEESLNYYLQCIKEDPAYLQDYLKEVQD